MVSARAGALVLLAGSQLAQTLRLDESALGLDATTEVSKKEENMCTSQLVEDAVRCGVDQVIEYVTDGLKCGFEWCDSEVTFHMCPATCAGDAVDKPKTCEILLSCPITIELTIEGETPTSSINGLHLDAKLVDFKITQESLPDLQATIDGNYDTILPWMQEVVDIVLPLANTELHNGVANFERDLVGELENNIVNQYAWVARLILGGKGFGDGVLSAVKKQFDKIGAKMERRFEVTAPVENTKKDKLCHRVLRIRPQDGVEYLISNWENAEVARHYDFATDCNTVYTAHCGTGTFTKTQKCPGWKKPATKNVCLRSMFCWASKRTISGAENKVVTLFNGDKEVVSYADVLVDHVAAPDASAEKSQVSHAKVSSGEEDPEELETLVQIFDNDLPGVLKHEVCSQLRKNAWWGTGAIVAARCGVMFSTLLRFAEISVPMKLSQDVTVDADISLTGGVFKTQFIPKWDEFSAAADDAVHAAIAASGETLPLSAEVVAVNSKIRGDAQNIYVEARPVLKGILSESQIEELRQRITGKP